MLSGSQNTIHARPVSPNWDSSPDALCSSPSMAKQRSKNDFFAF